MPQQPARDSHIVPKTYLKHFTRSNGKLFKIKKISPKRPIPQEVHPSQICYKKGFYQFSNQRALQGYYIKESNILEDYGFLYENNLKKFIDKLINPIGLLSIDDAISIGTILLDLKVRNAYYREHSFSKENISESINQILADDNHRLQSIARARGIPLELIKTITEAMRDEWMKDEGIAKELHNRSLLENKVNPSPIRRLAYNKLARGKWIVLKTSLNHQFITSDNPGYSHDQADRVFNIKFAGQCGFFFPLTPFHMLSILVDGDEEGPLPTHIQVAHSFVEPMWVTYINRGTCIVAHKELYAANESSLLNTWYEINSNSVF